MNQLTTEGKCSVFCLDRGITFLMCYRMTFGHYSNLTSDGLHFVKRHFVRQVIVQINWKS